MIKFNRQTVLNAIKESWRMHLLTYLLNYLMFKFNVLKWFRLWKQMTQISAVHNCCCWDWGCCWFFHGWSNTNNFPLIFLGFPDSMGTKFCQKIRIQDQLKNQSEKVTFFKYISSTKKNSEQFKEFKEFKEFKNW